MKRVDGDRMRWLFENYAFGAGRDCDEAPDDDQLADFIEDLREDFASERSASEAGAAPTGIETLDTPCSVECCDQQSVRHMHKGTDR